LSSADTAVPPPVPLTRHPAVPYVLPFAIFLFFLAVQSHIPLDQKIEFPLRVLILGAVLWFFSRHVIDLRVRNFAGSTGIGVVVFVIWVAPDLLWPDYRSHWLFQNLLTGTRDSSIAEGVRTDFLVLFFRTLRAVIIVPIVEELFWRGWLMRWLVSSEFHKLPLGAYTRSAFWITAVLFASEHGPYWEVGLIAGIAYNWWIIRTRSLGDLIYTHAVTNACLCAFILLTNRWEYWL
jgi:CAAX prenyl protease-like protein